MIEISMDYLKRVCNGCRHRSKTDNLFYMAFWSHCQSKCKFMQVYNAAKITHKDLDRELYKNTGKTSLNECDV